MIVRLQHVVGDLKPHGPALLAKLRLHGVQIIDRTGEEPAIAAVASACDPIEASAPGPRREALGGAPRREEYPLQRGERAANLMPAIIGAGPLLPVNLGQQPAAIRAALYYPAGSDGADNRGGACAPHERISTSIGTPGSGLRPV